MKKIISILTILIVISGLSGCGANKKSNTPIPTDKVISSSTPEVKKNFSKIGVKLYIETMNGIFGPPKHKENIIAEVDEIVKRLGAPKKEYGRWYFKQGIVIDVSNMNDSFFILMNYVYINPSSKISTSRNIKIGSTKEEVLKAYKEEINPRETNDNIIVAGMLYNGIGFVIKNDKVKSIYIGTGAFEEGGETLKRS